MFQSLAMFTPRPRGQYNLQDMATAFNEVLQSGETVAKVARKYKVPRKTLENYVSGRTNIETLYKKLGDHHKYGKPWGHSGHQYQQQYGETQYGETQAIQYSGEDVEVL